MRNLKKLLMICLVVMLVLTGCNKTTENKRGSEEFEEFTNSLVNELISDDDFDINFLFLDPIAIGINPELYQLPFTSLEEAKENSDYSNDVLKRLEEFDYKKLTDSQKLTYEVIKDVFESDLDPDKFYYISTNYLGSYLGYQAQLPLLLMEFTFNNEQDILSYFNVLKTMEETFVEYAELEKQRQAQGVGMPQIIIDKVIEQCINITSEDEIFLIEMINRKIDDSTFLSDDKKAEYKERNITLLNNDYINAYKRLGTELSTIESDIIDLGLTHLPNGKEYYEYLVKQNTGTNISVNDLKQYVDEHFDMYLDEFIKLLSNNMSVYERIYDADTFGEFNYTSHTSFEEVIDYLAIEMLKDYPEVGNLNYEVTLVPEAMADNFSPAAYLSGKIDAPIDYPERIFINGEFSQSLFETLAHEGYPGHMYQNSFFRQTDAPIIRYLFNHKAYTEGWATYVENRVWKYAEVDNEEDLVLLELLKLNNQLTQMLMIQLDIGVHYDGWSRETFKEFLIQNFGEQPDESVYDAQYDNILETPANTLAYYFGGAKFDELYRKAEKELGEKFDAIEFNRVVLTCGPASFEIVEKQVDNYIKETKK